MQSKNHMIRRPRRETQILEGGQGNNREGEEGPRRENRTPPPPATIVRKVVVRSGTQKD